MDRPARMHEAETVALELLHDESFTAEQPDADAALERAPDRYAACAQANEPFWQLRVPPNCFRSIARIFPGYGAANDTCCLPPPEFVKTVMKRLSPVMSRLPAPSIAFITPPPRCWAPSPNTVSIEMPLVMYI